MKQIILNGIEVEELIDRISDVFQSKIDRFSLQKQSANNATYLSRAEVAQLLKISLPTLHEWTKLKVLQSYKIGNRVLYQKDQVEQALKQSSTFKYKRHSQ